MQTLDCLYIQEQKWPLIVFLSTLKNWGNSRADARKHAKKNIRTENNRRGGGARLNIQYYIGICPLISFKELLQFRFNVINGIIVMQTYRNIL